MKILGREGQPSRMWSSSGCFGAEVWSPGCGGEAGGSWMVSGSLGRGQAKFLEHEIGAI